MNQAKVSIYGRLIKDPNQRQVNGSTVINMAVAVRTTKKQEGSQYYDDDIYNVEVWGKTAESLLTMVQKGTNMIIYGEQYMESFQNRNGEKVTYPHVRASSVQVISGTKNTQNTAPAPAADDPGDPPF